MATRHDAVTFDEALAKWVGQLGRWQLTNLLAASLPLLGNAAAFFFFVFAAQSPVGSHGWACSSASDAACQAVWQQEHPTSQELCSLSPAQWHWTSTDSLVAEFNLVCGDAWKVQITNSLMFVGAFVGSGLFGFACDRWGRKRPLFVATALVAVAMYASLAAPSFWVMAALRVVTGFGAAGQSHCIFLLCTEPVGPALRGAASIITLTVFVVGEFLMVALAYALPSWRHLALACASINAGCLLLYPCVPESARWLLSRGRSQEATEQLRRMAAANGTSLPPQRLVSSHDGKQQLPDGDAAAYVAAEQGRACTGSSDGDARGSGGSSGAAGAVTGAGAPISLRHLLAQPRLVKRLLVLLLTSFSLMLNYYGISMGAGGIPGSIYMTFAVGVAAEAVALLLVGPSVDRIGRHNCVSLGQLLGGGACLACAMVRGGTMQAALAAVGKFGCAAAQAVMSLYVAEMLPTACRSSVLGICSQASRVGSITAPFLLMLGAQLGSLGGRSQVLIPFLVFGSLAVLSGLLMLLMPETLGADMPENMEDMHNLLSAFTARPWRQGMGSTLAFIFRTRAAVTRGMRVSSPASTRQQSIASPIRIRGSRGSQDAEVHVSTAADVSDRAQQQQTKKAGHAAAASSGGGGAGQLRDVDDTHGVGAEAVAAAATPRAAAAVVTVHVTAGQPGDSR